MKQLIIEQLDNIKQLKALETGLNKLYTGKCIFDPYSETSYRVEKVKVFYSKDGPMIYIFHKVVEKGCKDRLMQSDIKDWLEKMVKPHKVIFMDIADAATVLKETSKCELLRNHYCGTEIRLNYALPAVVIHDFICINKGIRCLVKPIDNEDPSRLQSRSEIKHEMATKYNVSLHNFYFSACPK